MKRLAFFIVALLFAPVLAAQSALAIIIDDVGYDAAAAEQLFGLPPEVTLAILPQLPHSASIAERAHLQGREVMLHFPMETLNARALGPGGFTLQHTRLELNRVLEENLASVPYARGVNNHMGSLLTSESAPMQALMDELHQRGDLYFIDSRTNKKTVAEQTARHFGLPTARRDVFLDNQTDPDYIRAQFGKAIRLAKQRGSAIAIGHPYPETLAVLAAMIPELAAHDVRLLPVSCLIELQRRPPRWLASSSRLPKVAKSSKP